MAEAMDAGDIIAQFTEDIQPTDTHLTLTTRLFQRSAEYLSEIITEYLSHQSNPNRYKLKAKSYSLYLPPQPQDNNQATFSHTFTKNHAHLPWDLIMAAITGQPAPVNLFPSSLKKHITDQYQPDQAARYVERAIRALSPWPGAWTQVPHLTTQKGQPRRLKLLKANLETSKPETLKLIEVRLEGKSTVSWEQFKAAYLDKN
jgi:methionyl-tRNA formyltransferase